MEKQSLRQIRETVRETQARTAYHARVSEPTVRMFEANPQSIKDATKRAALEAVYARYALAAIGGAL
jgi:DNA-binding XRE family transcriptional regulator